MILAAPRDLRLALHHHEKVKRKTHKERCEKDEGVRKFAMKKRILVMFKGYIYVLKRRYHFFVEILSILNKKWMS